MKLLEGKVALITGAARGIGNAIAHKFAAEGADIAFTDLALNEEHLANINRAAEEIAAHGVKCIGYASNAADFAETEAVVAKIKADFGRIDILVNNAGITKDGLMLRMSEAQWDAVINVNLKSAFNFIHACCPIMLRQKGGSIINMSSVVGVHGNAGQCNYSASKAGRDGTQGYPRQCRRSRLHRDSHDCSAATGCSRRVDEEDTASSWWSDRRYRQRLRFPRQ